MVKEDIVLGYVGSKRGIKFDTAKVDLTAMLLLPFQLGAYSFFLDMLDFTVALLKISVK